MLKHLKKSAEKPKRVVVIGARSFIAKAAINKIHSEGIEILPVTRNDIDLLSYNATEKLAAKFKSTDSVIFAAAVAPVKNPAMLVENIQIAANVCEALKQSPVSHIVNISSDAVYSDSPNMLTENSVAEPHSLHGVMHLSRELILASELETPIVSVRPTLIYGAEDPHNGYGPNRFRRLAAEGEEIVLFGEGEERRDHVLVDDVAEIIFRCIAHRSTGKINAVSGYVMSFKEAAQIICSHFENPPKISSSQRSGPMPHNGYRAFDNSATSVAFPDFRYKNPKEGFSIVHKILSEQN